MSCVSGNLIAHALGWKDSNLIYNSLVSVEVESKASVILLDDCASTLLDGLGSDTLKEEREKRLAAYSVKFFEGLRRRKHIYPRLGIIVLIGILECVKKNMIILFQFQIALSPTASPSSHTPKYYDQIFRTIVDFYIQLDLQIGYAR